LGLMSLLMNSHREFEIVTPRTLENFRGEVLALPDARCLGDQELAALENFAKSGGKLVVTGKSGDCDDTGKARESNPLHQFLGIRNPAQKSMGTAGLKYSYLPECPGQAYWRALGTEFNDAATRGDAAGRSFQSLRHEFDTSVIQALGLSAPVQVEASPFITTQMARV